MKTPNQSKIRIVSVVLAFLPLGACSPDILFATRTSTGLEINGDIAKVPDHINLGYRRRELAYVGRQVPKSASVIGRLDSETTWNGGAAIRESFATGRAAEHIARGSAGEDRSDGPGDHTDRPLVFASRSRIGFGYNLGGADDDAIPSLYLGYNRRIATRMVVDREIHGRNIPSVLAETKMHSSGVLARAETPKADEDFALSPGAEDENKQGGIRIRNLFAIGSGADEYLSDPEKAKELRDSMVQLPEAGANGRGGGQ